MDLSLPQANRKTQGGSTQSSCFGPSLVVTSTTTLPSLPLSVVNHAASRALLHPQSLLPAGFWSGLTTLSSPCLSHHRLLLDIFQIPQPASYCHVNFRRPASSFNHKREHSQAPGYHLSNRVSINSAFQNQDKRRTGQFVVRRAEKMTTAVFSVKTLKVPRAFWQQFDAPGKEKKKKKSPIQANMAKTHLHTGPSHPSPQMPKLVPREGACLLTPCAPHGTAHLPPEAAAEVASLRHWLIPLNFAIKDHHLSC